MDVGAAAHEALPTKWRRRTNMAPVARRNSYGSKPSRWRMRGESLKKYAQGSTTAVTF